jgi:hypothetical protein
VVVSVCGHDSNDSKYTFEHECYQGSLVGGKSKTGKYWKTPIVITEVIDGVTYWHAPNDSEFKALRIQDGGTKPVVPPDRLFQDK